MGVSEWFWSAGPSGFGSCSTAEDVTRGIDASNLTVIVTGATSGIGLETAQVLAMRGAKVILASITMECGLEAKESILNRHPEAKLDVIEIDLSSLESVYSFAQSFSKAHQHLNILVNNAGIMGCRFQLSKDGVELQFAINYLGHFLLTNLLLEKMRSTAEETGIQGRIVCVSSVAHKHTDTSLSDLDQINDPSKYDPYMAYCFSKLAVTLFANELSRRLQVARVDVTVNYLHPGMIATNIGQYVLKKGFITSVALFLANTAGRLFVKSIPQGAATTCYVALHENVRDVSGSYFVDCNEATPSINARDEGLAEDLWQFSLKLLKQSNVRVEKILDRDLRQTLLESVGN